MKLIAIPLLLIASGTPACAQEADVTANQLPPARDGNVAIQEELDAARRAGTLEAYDLFIARHPRHPLAETAKREREQISRGRAPRAD